MLLLSSTIIKNAIVPINSKYRINFLEVDDSLYSRSRSKSVKLLARVRDHLANKYVKDLRLLTLGWLDDNTFYHKHYHFFHLKIKKIDFTQKTKL